MNYAFPGITSNEIQILKFISICGSHSLAYHSLQPEISHFTTKFGYIAFRDIQNETIVLGDPISKEENFREIIEQFLKFRPQCSFIQISHTFSEILARMDFSINYFGVESQIELPISIKGKEKKEIRLLSNVAQRNNILVREIFNRDELQSLTIKNNKLSKFNFGLHANEYAFLSRPILKIDEKDVRIFGGFQNDRLVCYSLFDPMYSDNKIIGYAEAITRQAYKSPKGSRVYTLLQAMDQFALEEKEFVNIGLLPFYQDKNLKDKFKTNRNNIVELIFTMLYKSSPLVSNFAGLSFHKSRYRGKLLPKYFATNSKKPYKSLLCIYKLTTGNWLPHLRRL